MNPRAPCLPIDLHRDNLRDVLALLFDAFAYTFDHIAPDELARLRGSSVDLMQAASDDRLRPLGAGRHSDGIVSCVFESEQPLDLARLNHFFDAAMQRFGTRLWRIKGVVHAEQQRQRLVVQGVQSLLQFNGGAVWRAREPRRTVLVFIGQGLDRRWIGEALRSCEGSFTTAN